MFGIPISVIQLIIVVLRALGVTTWAGNLSLKLITHLIAKAESAKSYHDNADFPQPAPGITNKSNLIVKQPT